MHRLTSTLAVRSAGHRSFTTTWSLNINPTDELLQKLDLVSLSFASLGMLDACVKDIARTIMPERAVGVNAPP